jgi:hypothetical protein
MKRFVVAAALLMTCVGFFGGPARAEGQNWEACLTPPRMAQIVSVLTLDGKATEAQYMARAHAFALWLAENVHQFRGDPAKAVDAGLAAPAVVSAGEGESVVITGSNTPYCVVAKISTLDGCYHIPAGPLRTECIKGALEEYIRCLRLNCWTSVTGQDAFADLRCAGTSSGPPPCSKFYKFATPIAEQNGRFRFHVYVNNYDSGGPSGGNMIEVRAAIPSATWLTPMLTLPGGISNQDVDLPAPASPGVGLGVFNAAFEVNLDKGPSGLNDYAWEIQIICY